jgi:putative ABC transport system permease protein
VTSRRRRPPAAARLLAALFPPRDDAAEAAIGDLEEEYADRADRGTFRAAAWYWAEAASLGRGFAAERLRGWRRGRTSAGLVRRRGDSTMRTLWEDLRLAFRGLRQKPGFAAAVVATLALGIGGNVALFSVVDGVLLRPLPYPDPERLVILWENDRLRGTDREGASAPDYLDLVEQSRSFETMAARTGQNRTLGTAAEPVHVSSARVSSTYFPLLGVRAVLGRTLDAADEQPGAEHVLVLSEGLWRERFAAEPAVVGRSLLIDGTPATVVGVVPDRATVPGLSEKVFEPLVFTADEQDREIHNFRVFARLKPVATVATAQGDAAAVMARLEKTYPDQNEGRGAWVRPLVDEVVGGSRPALLLLFGAVALLLLMACASAANLVLARGISRERELAVRTSLGAEPLRIFRLLLTESLLLATLGGALGTLLAAGTIALVRVLGPEDLARLQECAVDGRALLFALLASLASALVFGALPALRGARRSPAASLKQGGRVAGASGLRARRFLVAFELAAAVVLVVGAGLLVRSFSNLRRVDPGYDPKNLLLAHLSLTGPGYEFPKGWPVLQWPAYTAFADALRKRLEAQPGVLGVAFAHQGPADPGWATGVTVEGHPPPTPGEQAEASYRPVSPGYFRTLGVPILRGREFGRFDGPGAPPVAVVNEAFAARHFPGEDPVGRRILVARLPREIVGLAGDERFEGIEAGPAPAMYLPIDQNPQPSVTVAIRTASDPLAAVPALRAALRATDPTRALFEVETAEQALAGSLRQRRFVLVLLGGFAAVALLLAAVGTYGVVSFAVGERTREVGVRIALGARPAHVFGLVVRQGMTLAAVAVGLGVLGALALGRVMENLLFGVGARDPLTLATVAAGLLLTAFSASALPALRATRVDPVRALRLE